MRQKDFVDEDEKSLEALLDEGLRDEPKPRKAVKRQKVVEETQSQDME
jgi:hypothetical protein